MANSKELSNKQWKEYLAQSARAELPFNPVGGDPITGGNLGRLQQAMQTQGWTDTRFISKPQAIANGWTLSAKPVAVEILVRDAGTGTIASQQLFNAANVRGMPSLATILAMEDEAMTHMREAEEESKRPEEITVSPVRQLVREQGTGPAPEATPSVANEAATAVTAGNAVGAGIGGAEPQVERFAAMAPYWLNGLHNFEGLALAKEINEVIHRQRMERDKAALDKLMAVYPQARGFGIGIVSESQLLNDPHIKANLAEPNTLLGGDLVRDSCGMYRPKDGGRPVLQDQGSSVVLKSKGAQSYRAAMELALSKGWTAIELSGKKSMLAEAWLEARLLGLNVVNYIPNEKDKEKYAERLALESQRKAEHPSVEKGSDEIEVRPQSLTQTPQQTPAAPLPEKVQVVDSAEVQKATARAPEPTYRTLSNFGAARYQHVNSNNPSYFAELVDQHGAVETLWGLGIESSLKEVGAKIGDAITLVSIGKKPVEVMQPQPDGSYKAVQGERLNWQATVNNHEKADRQQTPVTAGLHIGVVMAISDGKVAQKVGRDPASVVWHDLSKLTGDTPELGDVAQIHYTNGAGSVITSGQIAERAGGRRGVGR